MESVKSVWSPSGHAKTDIFLTRQSYHKAALPPSISLGAYQPSNYSPREAHLTDLPPYLVPYGPTASDVALKAMKLLHAITK